jgi:F-type H+-transporting ATPase subunit b
VPVASSNFLVPGPTFVVELAIFLIVLWALNKWVLPPINRAMEDRQRAIERSLNEAAEATKRAHELEEQRERILEQGRAEARALRDEAARVGEQLREQLRKQGEEEYERLVGRASSDIEASTRRAAEELRAQVAGLVVAVVERVLDEGVSSVIQAQLVDRAIGEVEAQAAAAGHGALGPASAGAATATRAGR